MHAPWVGSFLSLATVKVLVIAGTVWAQEPPPRVQRDVEFARVGQTRLALDLYMPARPDPPPVVVWVHGGAWRSGSRANVPLAGLTAHGFAVASVDYRLSPMARFPAQVHDLKAAIRFLRAHAERLGIRGQRIAIAGASAGGHLAVLVGVTAGVPELEGEVGEHRDPSSAVQAIVDFYGPTNLTTILAQSTPHGLSVRVPALELLLGGQPQDRPELARLASPVFHVDPLDPPVLIVHGDQDPQVPIDQSHELVKAYRQAGLPVRFETVPGGGHGGPGFFTPGRLSQVAAFLTPLLQPADPRGKRPPDALGHSTVKSPEDTSVPPASDRRPADGDLDAPEPRK